MSYFTCVWKPAEVLKLKSAGRFEVMVNNEEDFLETYGPEDEGSEWRRMPAYDGLKRQRKSVEKYEPAEMRVSHAWIDRVAGLDACAYRMCSPGVCMVTSGACRTVARGVWRTE